ncbi:uncharacterized protein MYCFIDRAFT_48343 [Pseudocercospora fijiensis CIRAD86]|uniref:Uncharacterized protein n=1 Tax=Pseudocercospora fijiensis (strain CIRAD86) TaxID=383855 RepID=N1QAX7_PSEFD|nr:uncharacterized protein MYCFIDRAFT_48343 [Pseudocercospora fijiensis CIRAD86]EME88148.1 hypothetical protein MYCFIDRAFT_48343 [Pseudocercospora fijiensis CIRAD86]
MAPFKLQNPPNREILGGDLLAQALQNLGTDVAFGLHGGHLDAFLLGAHDCGIRLIDTRHETTAVQAAEGYAKISGKVGVCFVTANSGFSNGLPGLATAFADRSPVFCITSSPPLQDAETNALQGFHDQVIVAKPITKFAHRVTNVEEIPRIVAYAFRSANTGIKGPVLIDFPIDVLFSPPQLERVAFGAVDVPPASLPAPDPAAVDRLLNAWKTAKRPVIITGTGARGTDKVLKQFAESTNTPVFYSSKFSTPIPADHELRAGPASALAAFAGKEHPDFVLLLAARTGFLLGGRGGAIIPNDATIAQVDLDGGEIGKSHAIDIGIVSDAGLFCEAVVSKAGNAGFGRNDAWIKKCHGLNNTALPYAKDGKVMPDGQLHPYHAMVEVMKALPPDSIIIVDGGEAGQWAAMTLELAKPHVAIVATGYLGFLGNGWGYSIGAAVADPSRLVVNIHGDGSAGFHIQELDTIARFNLNVLTLVTNNFAWGMSVNGQDLLYEKQTKARPATALSKACAYEVVAQGFNCAGVRITQPEEIGPAISKLTKAGPSLANMIVSVKPTTPATLSMVGMTDDPNWIVVPYYDNVPRPFYKLSGANGNA